MTDIERNAETLVKRLGKAIRIRRTIMEKSQQEVARLAGCHSAYLSQIELGRACPSIQLLVQIATALGVTVESLFASAAKLVEEEAVE